MIYVVENEEASINDWGCYWVVEAANAKEAIDKVYEHEVEMMPPKESGILKLKLYAYRADKAMRDGVYMIH